jgi:hypothetical protein
MLAHTGTNRAYTFRYLTDPLFVCCSFVYTLNRFFIKPVMPRDEVFFRGYLNDLLLIPCLLPPILFVHRKLSWRHTDHSPSAGEIFIHLTIWSLLFEYIGPRFYARATSDPFDVVSYTIGGLCGWVVWNQTPGLTDVLKRSFFCTSQLAHRLLHRSRLFERHNAGSLANERRRNKSVSLPKSPGRDSLSFWLAILRNTFPRSTFSFKFDDSIKLP